MTLGFWGVYVDVLPGCRDQYMLAYSCKYLQPQQEPAPGGLVIFGIVRQEDACGPARGWDLRMQSGDLSGIGLCDSWKDGPTAEANPMQGLAVSGFSWELLATCYSACRTALW